MIPWDGGYNGAIDLLDDIRLELVKNPLKYVVRRGNDEEDDALDAHHREAGGEGVSIFESVALPKRTVCHKGIGHLRLDILYCTSHI